MPLIYKPYQANIANKAGQKLYYPRLVKFSKMVNTQKMAELIAEKASLTPGDVHNVIRNLMSVMREQLLNSRTVRLEGLGTFTMIAKAGGKGVVLESKVSSSQIAALSVYSRIYPFCRWRHYPCTDFRSRICPRQGRSGRLCGRR